MSAGVIASQMMIRRALTISGTPVTSATQNTAYAGFTVSATGGTSPYTFSVATGSLPTGITLNSSTGDVSGTPTVSGSFIGIVIRVTDNVGATADLASFDLTVTADVSYPTLDAASSSNVTLSNGNLTVTSTGGTSTNQGAKALAAKSSGKWYFEITVTTKGSGGNNGAGVATDASTYSNLGNSATTGDILFTGSGNIWRNGGNSGISLGVRATGDVIGVAIDLDNHQAWFRVAPSGNWNNSASKDPATNTGGIIVTSSAAVEPVACFNSNGAAFTFNFGASAFVGTPPSGFTAGWPS